MAKKSSQKNNNCSTNIIRDDNLSKMMQRVTKEIHSDINNRTLIIPICFPQADTDDETHLNTLKNLRHKLNTIFVGLIDDETNEHQGISPDNISVLIQKKFLEVCKNSNVKIYLSGHSDTSYFEFFDEHELLDILQPLLRSFSVKSIVLDSCHTADSFEKQWCEQKMSEWLVPPKSHLEIASARLNSLDMGKENLTKRLSGALFDKGFEGINVVGFRGEVYHSLLNSQNVKNKTYSRYCRFFRMKNSEVFTKSSEARIIYKNGECIEQSAKYQDTIQDKNTDTLYAYNI